MSLATVLIVEESAVRVPPSRPTRSHHGVDTTPTTISIVHLHRSKILFPPSVIMRSDQESAWADRNESKSASSSSSSSKASSCDNRTRSSHPLVDWKHAGEEESSRTVEDASMLDDDEAEPIQPFLFTKSPMPSLRRVGLSIDDDKPFATLATATSGTSRRHGVLDRTTSAPISSCCGSSYSNPNLAKEGQHGRNTNCRRSIFGPFWESSSSLGKQKERFQMPRRGHSLDVLEASFPHHRQRERALSGQFASMSLRSKEEYIAAFDSFLPSVPAPLERLLSRSSGVYPLFEPKSILKKDSGNMDDPVGGLKPTLTKVLSDGSNAVEDNATETTYASSSMCKAVHFDPRVVVTEVHDPFPRSWYTDQELQKFQSDTCKLAKAYLQMHPELVPFYSKPVYDPIIKKMRRKPLFGLQGISDLDVCLNEMPIKRILVVAPNDKILSLLCRSLQMIFPVAEMVRTHNSISAMDILKRSDVDLAICQERLSPRNSSPGHEADTSADLFSKYQREEGEKWRRTLLISISPDMEKSAERSIVTHGASDLVWTLPPPKMNLGLQGTLVVALDKKRRGDSHLA